MLVSCLVALFVSTGILCIRTARVQRRPARNSKRRVACVGLAELSSASLSFPSDTSNDHKTSDHWEQTNARSVPDKVLNLRAMLLQPQPEWLILRGTCLPRVPRHGGFVQNPEPRPHGRQALHAGGPDALQSEAGPQSMEGLVHTDVYTSSNDYLRCSWT